MLESLTTILNSFRIQDLLDILIIATMTYILLVWIRNTASRFVFLGILLLSILYLSARIFHLYLTTYVLQAFFAILIFALLIIFQEEIRRILERLATIGKFGRNLDQQQPTDVLVESIKQLSELKCGALIVLPGRDPLNRHLQGGYSLEGNLSQPLLASIFDHHSDGHDGAVIINEGKLSRFGCHLPLCTDGDKCGHLGLRHTAAIGLTERCDAFCIVVSEERGSISYCRRGELVPITHTGDLVIAINNFYDSLKDSSIHQPVTRWFRQNLSVKLLALGLAVGAWFFFGSQREEIQRVYTIPIEFRKVSPEWVIEEGRTNTIDVTLAGPPQAFNVFDPSRLKISLDLSHIEEGRQNITLTADMIKIPSNLTLLKFDPRRISINAYRLYPYEVKIDVPVQGQLPAGLIIKSINGQPRSVKVLASKAALQNLSAIKSQPLQIDKLTESTTLELDLVLPPGVRLSDGAAAKIKVSVEIETASGTSQATPLRLLPEIDELWPFSHRFS